MAIKVIKHGNKVFTAVCPICGCEFEYEVEDLVETDDKESLTYGAKVRAVKCPECGEVIKHKEYTIINPTPSPIYPSYPQTPWTPLYPNNWPWITWATTTDGTGNLDCSKCPNRPDPSKPVVGDTPCTWCKKNVPYCGDIFPTGYSGGQSTGSYSVDPREIRNYQYINTNIPNACSFKK